MLAYIDVFANLMYGFRIYGAHMLISACVVGTILLVCLHIFGPGVYLAIVNTVFRSSLSFFSKGKEGRESVIITHPTAQCTQAAQQKQQTRKPCTQASTICFLPVLYLPTN